LVTIVLEEYTSYIFRVYSENAGSAWKLLVGKPEGRRQLGRPRCKWENAIKSILEK
jgi:hypothetical protein